MTSPAISPVDKRFMRVAIRQARHGRGHASPNPTVGAVLVLDGRIIARGFHLGPGTPHAEIVCLAQAPRRSLRRATLYVTLEPCSTAGRTPPCCEALAGAHVGTVVYGATDPNPKHSGRAENILRHAGIAVRTGVLAEECAALNPGFNKWIRTGMPYVVLKCGMSLDGKLTRPPAESRWLTGAESREAVQTLRAGVDAILVGAETLRQDDPRLTVRRPGAFQPWRVIVSHSQDLPPSAKVFRDAHASRTIVVSGKSLRAVLRGLGRRGITSVLIEGGGKVLGQALDEKLADRVEIFIAPLFSGGPVLSFDGKGAAATAQASWLAGPVYRRSGGDLWISAEILPGKKI